MNHVTFSLLSGLRGCIARMGIVALALALSAGLAYAQAGTVRFAVIGDYGHSGQAEADVAARVKGWNPDFIITLGDNNYENGEASTIDQNIGQYFHEYICPYYGSYGTQPAGCANRFFPSLGNHDWHAPGALPYLDYFTLPGNERYYDLIRGPVHLFAVDSDPFEPHGIFADSTQAAWLQAALGASTSPWKLVYFHHAPYSSGSSSPWMQWPFGAWGASAVLAGHYHNYERLTVGGLTYVVNGLGGAMRYISGALLGGSQVRFDSDYGAMLIEADAESMTMEFYTRTGVLVDVATLYAGGGTAPTVRFEPATVTGGTSVTGTIILAAPAPAGGTYVGLSVDPPSVLSIPPGIVVPAGASSIDFPVQTGASAVPVAATLVAGFGNAVKKAALTVLPPVLGSVTFAATRSVGGQPASASVNLTGPAPAGGVVVNLASNHDAARVPPSVTIAAGAASATFTIDTDPVIQDTSAVVTAALGYAKKSATLTLMPLLKSLSLGQSSLTGSVNGKGTVTLNAAATDGGVAVSLASGSPQAVVPGVVTVPAGATSASFVILTSAVAVDVSVPISASVEGVTRSANLVIKAPAVSALTLNPTSVSGGTASTATATLSGLAPEGGIAVTLSSANPQVASLPAVLSVAAGTKSASVPVATLPVLADTSVLLTASLNGAGKSSTLTVKIPVVAYLSLSAVSVTGGTTSKATVTLSNPAPPGGVTVTLSSANTGAAGVPGSLTVAAGASSAAVTVTTTPVAADTPVTLTATLNGASKSTTLTVKAAVLSALAVSSSSVTGGATTKATATLSGPAPSSGVTVALSSANPGTAAVPASVYVVAGAKSASGTVSTVPVAANVPVALTATLNGASKSTTLTVKAPVVSALAVSSSSVTGGGATNVTVTLTGVAPTGGVSVALSSANPGVANVPASVSVAAGAKSGVVSVSTVPVAADTPVALTAALGGASKSTTLTVKAPVVAALTVSPSSVTGGNTATATVTLSGNAHANGVTVTLSSGQPAAAGVPATANVAAGAKTANFAVTTFPVAADTAVTLGASLNGVGKTTLLTVKQ